MFVTDATLLKSSMHKIQTDVVGVAAYAMAAFSQFSKACYYQHGILHRNMNTQPYTLFCKRLKVPALLLLRDCGNPGD